jgi:glycosyltransferase involved in cell wall biosynthesis
MSFLRGLRELDKNLYVFTPVALPLYGRSKIEKLNSLFVLLQVQLMMFRLGMKRPLIWTSIPSSYPIIKRLKRSGLVYLCSDKYDSYREITAQKRIKELDEQLLAMADVVFCASKLIYDHCRSFTERAYYLSHGVDYTLFNKVMTEDLAIPSDIEGIPRPIVGYFGSLTDSFDQENIFYCATKHPDLSFVLIGRTIDDFSRLASLPNVYFLGYKEYEELPAYGAQFDVCLLNWKMTEWIRHSNPLKTNEYLAMGKPVVSVPIDEIETTYENQISTARTKEEFCEMILREIETDSLEKRRRRAESVRSDTWEVQVERMSDCIMKHIASIRNLEVE